MHKKTKKSVEFGKWWDVDVVFVKILCYFKMKIYELPYDINKELCRLLDIDDDWKKLAGDHMQYYPFDIIVSTNFHSEN